MTDTHRTKCNWCGALVEDIMNHQAEKHSKQVIASIIAEHFMCFYCAGATAVLKHRTVTSTKHVCEWCSKFSNGFWVSNIPPTGGKA